MEAKLYKALVHAHQPHDNIRSNHPKCSIITLFGASGKGTHENTRPGTNCSGNNSLPVVPRQFIATKLDLSPSTNCSRERVSRYCNTDYDGGTQRIHLDSWREEGEMAKGAESWRGLTMFRLARTLTKGSSSMSRMATTEDRRPGAPETGQAKRTLPGLSAAVTEVFVMTTSETR